MLHKEVIAVYCENQMKPIISLCGQKEFLNVEASGTYSNLCV
jgi:hypothetical protein